MRARDNPSIQGKQERPREGEFGTQGSELTSPHQAAFPEWPLESSTRGGVFSPRMKLTKLEFIGSVAFLSGIWLSLAVVLFHWLNEIFSVWFAGSSSALFGSPVRTLMLGLLLFIWAIAPFQIVRYFRELRGNRGK